MIEIVLASRNADKAREIAALVRAVDVRLRLVAEFAEAPEVEETGDTFAANAALKAWTVARALDRLSVADDSGLVVPALHGLPGVRSARFAGPGCTYADNRALLLAELAGRGHRLPVPAEFVCCVALAGPEGLRFSVEARVAGAVVAPRGAGGFGYDPVFLYPPLGRTFAELDPEEKNRVSHRAAAFAEFARRLPRHLSAAVRRGAP